MTWSSPAARMREFVLAMRAIWTSWHDGTKLDFNGEYYTHTLMTPFFSPGPSEYGQPEGVARGRRRAHDRGRGRGGRRLDRARLHDRALRAGGDAAGDRARAVAQAGRSRANFEVSGPLFVVSGANAEEMAAASRPATRQQIAFYGSTPAYRPVLALHGWGELGDELNVMSKRGEWVAMGELITDEILDTFAVVAEPDDVATKLLARYGGLVDRLSFYDAVPAPTATRPVPMVASLRGAPA